MGLDLLPKHSGQVLGSFPGIEGMDELTVHTRSLRGVSVCVVLGHTDF